MQRLECPACHGYVDVQHTECPECLLELPQPAPTVTALPASSAAEDGDVLPVAVARLDRDALPASAASRPATTALHVARVLTVAMTGWLVVQTSLTWMAYGEGYIGSLVPAWNTAFTAGLGFIAYGVVTRRQWALGWARGVAILNALGNASAAVSAGAELLWIGVVIQVLCAIALHAAREQFVAGPKDGVNARLGRVLGVIAICGSIYVGFIAGTAPRGTERGREAFAQELRANYAANGADQVEVAVTGRTLTITSPEPDASIDAAAAAFRAELAKHPNNAKAWVLGFERILLTNGAHEQLILAPGR